MVPNSIKLCSRLFLLGCWVLLFLGIYTIFSFSVTSCDVKPVVVILWWRYIIVLFNEWSIALPHVVVVYSSYLVNPDNVSSSNGWVTRLTNDPPTSWERRSPHFLCRPSWKMGFRIVPKGIHYAWRREWCSEMLSPTHLPFCRMGVFQVHKTFIMQSNVIGFTSHSSTLPWGGVFPSAGRYSLWSTRRVILNVFVPTRQPFCRMEFFSAKRYSLWSTRRVIPKAFAPTRRPFRRMEFFQVPKGILMCNDDSEARNICPSLFNPPIGWNFPKGKEKSDCQSLCAPLIEPPTGCRFLECQKAFVICYKKVEKKSGNHKIALAKNKVEQKKDEKKQSNVLENRTEACSTNIVLKIESPCHHLEVGAWGPAWAYVSHDTMVRPCIR